MATLKPVPDCPGYLVGDDGSVWTIRLKGGNARLADQFSDTPRPLKTHLNATGYEMVCFCLADKVVTRAVHRLVLEAFVGPADDGQQACHYPDPCRTNNNLSNLRWGTAKDNAKDRFRDRDGALLKKCRRCGELKPLCDFYADKRASDGLHGECRACHCAVSVATRDKDSQRIRNREWMRKSRGVTPDRYRK